MKDKERVEVVKDQITRIPFYKGKHTWEESLQITTEILSLKENGKPMIAILSEDQTAPRILVVASHADDVRKKEKAMLASNFRRVIKEE